MREGERDTVYFGYGFEINLIQRVHIQHNTSAHIYSRAQTLALALI